MSKPPYRVLRVILGIFSLLTAVGGLIIIFGSRPMVMRLFLRPPESEVSTLLLIVMKEMGGLILMLSVMLFFAYRDPARNVAILDALTVGLCILAFTPLWSLLHAGHATTVSELPDLGAVCGAFGAGGGAVLPATARECS